MVGSEMTSVLLLLTALAGTGIRMAMLQSRVRALEEEAITDPLTGAFNRRHMQNTLATAVERRRRNGERASLLLFDVDRFKRINDKLGHAEGDRVLKTLVALIGQRMRKVDVLFRAGGEEFALLLTGARFPDALCVAEDIRRVVQDAGLVPGHPVSISVGVIELAHEQSAADWLAEADAALYRAKRGGRNRVAGRFGDPVRFANKQSGSNRLAFPARIS
jgi:diguanylate cyclase (GGDEF)-like protein